MAVLDNILKLKKHQNVAFQFIIGKSPSRNVKTILVVRQDCHLVSSW